MPYTPTTYTTTVTAENLNKGENGIAAAQAEAEARAPVNSPAFTGTPTAPTPAATDNTTKLATTAWAWVAITLGTPSIQTAAYTFVQGDKHVEYNSASAGSFTIPSFASVPRGVGTEIVVRQVGAGQLTIVGAAGVTLRARGDAFKLAGQWAEATITQRAQDDWVLAGDIVV